MLVYAAVDNLSCLFPLGFSRNELFFQFLSKTAVEEGVLSTVKTDASLLLREVFFLEEL